MPSKYKRPEINHDEFKDLINPLLGENFKIYVNKKRPKGLLQRDTTIDAWVPKEYDLEADRITKVYIKAENRQMVALLKDRAQRLYLWLLYELQSGRDYLWINKDRYMQENNITSINTYKDALADLMRYGFIVESFQKHVYWINPRLCFQGSRINKYPNAVEVIKEYEPVEQPKKIQTAYIGNTSEVVAAQLHN